MTCVGIEGPLLRMKRCSAHSFRMAPALHDGPFVLSLGNKGLFILEFFKNSSVLTNTALTKRTLDKGNTW